MRVTFKDVVDFVMEGVRDEEYVRSNIEDAVLKVRYEGSGENFKFLFGLLCCASLKSLFPFLTLFFLHFYLLFLSSLSHQILSYDHPFSLVINSWSHSE